MHTERNSHSALQCSFSAIVWTAVRIYVMFEYFNENLGCCYLVNTVYKPAYNSHNLLLIILLKWIESCKILEYTFPAFD